MDVVVTGATGDAGRAVCAQARTHGHRVIAVGTDPTRLAEVDADAREVADLTDAHAAAALAERCGRVDAVLHLVGGWKGGDTAEADAWLRPRLVDTLENTIAAFASSLTASGGRLAIVSSTAVRPGFPLTSSYARAKADAEELVGELSDRLDAAGGAATVFVIRSLGEESTPAALLAERLVEWLEAPAAEVNGTRVLL